MDNLDIAIVFPASPERSNAAAAPRGRTPACGVVVIVLAWVLSIGLIGLYCVAPLVTLPLLPCVVLGPASLLRAAYDYAKNLRDSQAVLARTRAVSRRVCTK